MKDFSGMPNFIAWGCVVDLTVEENNNNYLSIHYWRLLPKLARIL